MMKSKGHIILFVGPTCVGKTTLINELRARHFLNSGVIVSVTTRNQRKGEVNGADYQFVTEENFLSSLKDGDFYEAVKSPEGIYYGSSKKQVHELLESHEAVFGALDIEGCKKVKALEPDALVFFLYPSNMADLEKRLRARGDLPEEKIQIRLQRAREEMKHKDEFDGSIENVQGEFEKTINKAVFRLNESGIVPQLQGN